MLPSLHSWGGEQELLPGLQFPPGLWCVPRGSPGVLQAVPLVTPVSTSHIPPWALSSCRLSPWNLCMSLLQSPVASTSSCRGPYCDGQPSKEMSSPRESTVSLRGTPLHPSRRQPCLDPHLLWGPTADRPPLALAFRPAGTSVSLCSASGPRVLRGPGAQPQHPPAPTPSPAPRGRQGQRCASS